jgi:hypothetical protein
MQTHVCSMQTVLLTSDGGRLCRAQYVAITCVQYANTYEWCAGASRLDHVAGVFSGQLWLQHRDSET